MAGSKGTSGAHAAAELLQCKKPNPKPAVYSDMVRPHGEGSCLAGDRHNEACCTMDSRYEASGDRLTQSRGVQQLIAEGRRLRAEAMAHYFGLAGRGLATLAKTLYRPIAAWRERSTLAAELYGMTDHQLSDIGLTRCDIDAVASGGYRGQRDRSVRRLPLLVRLDPGVRRVKVERITETPKAA